MSDEDRELAERYLRGDRAAFGLLVERHQRRVYNIAYRLVGPSDADDATQDVFLTCLRKLGGFRWESAFTTWLYRVTVNVCTDLLRKRAREAPTDEPPDRPAEDRADAAVAAADIERALLKVPMDFRAPLVLHDVHDLPYEKIADALGVPVGTVKSRIHRGRVALARALRGEPGGPPHTSKVEEST